MHIFFLFDFATSVPIAKAVLEQSAQSIECCSRVLLRNLRGIEQKASRNTQHTHKRHSQSTKQGSLATYVSIPGQAQENFVV